MAQENGIRINKYLSEAGVCSRREADRKIQNGQVFINGKKAKAGDRVSKGDTVTADGKTVTLGESEIFLAFYKPKGVVCTTVPSAHDPDEINVIDYINYPTRVFPVGRLDKNSEGLLLLTNQGDIADQILRSRNAHEKEYFVRIDKKITEDFLQGMQRGVPILDTVTKPCKAWREDDFSFHIVLTQGLNRQIRRMCEYFGCRVVYLRRDRVLNITLDGLKKGRYRKLTPEEIASLKKELIR